MASLPKTFVTPEEYLERERKAETKSEYYQGEIFAMSGASRRHVRINAQLQFQLEQHLLGRRCELFNSDMRVLCLPSGLYTYPDLSVVCGEQEFADSDVDTLINPTLLVKILSPSTESHDRWRKTKLYHSIPSLKELLLIAQDSYDVELHQREPDGKWFLATATGLNASIELTSIGYTLRLGELYKRVVAGEADQK